MKIVDILIDSANLLGLTEESKVLQAVTAETENQILEENANIASLFNLVKFSIRELCTNYAPIITNEIIESTDKKYPVSNLPNFIRLQNVFKYGYMIKYKVINRNIIFDEDCEYDIYYATYPNISSMFDETDFLQNSSPDAIVFGLCAYYCLAHGMFENFEEFHETYVEKAESLKALRIFDTPARRW